MKTTAIYNFWWKSGGGVSKEEQELLFIRNMFEFGKGLAGTKEEGVELFYTTLINVAEELANDWERKYGR